MISQNSRIKEQWLRKMLPLLACRQQGEYYPFLYPLFCVKDKGCKKMKGLLIFIKYCVGEQQKIFKQFATTRAHMVYTALASLG